MPSDHPDLRTLNDEEYAAVVVPSKEDIRAAFSRYREALRGPAFRGYNRRMANPAVEFKRDAAEAKEKGLIIPFVLDKLLLAEVSHGEVSERLQALIEAQERSGKKVEEAVDALNSATALLGNYARGQANLAREQKERDDELLKRVDGLAKGVGDLYEAVGTLIAGQANSDKRLSKLSVVKLGVGGGVFVALDTIIRLIIETLKG